MVVDTAQPIHVETDSGGIDFDAQFTHGTHP
jgi:hypothetical protein